MKRSFLMKAFKSMVLLTAGVLALSACDKKSDNQTTATGTGAVQDTTTIPAAPATNDPNANSMTNTGAGAVQSDAGTGAAVGAGAASSSASSRTIRESDTTTSDGSGSISDEEVNDEMTTEDEYVDDGTDGTEFDDVQGTGVGTGRSGDNYEYVDESSSEPDDVRGGRDARMVPKNSEIDNSSSEPDLENNQ